MALRHAVLAALIDREASGYDLAKSFDVTVANFWTATPQQLYRELDKMESDDLVSARVIQQERRPNKRLFSITSHGRDVLRAFIQERPRPTAIRDELLVQIEAMTDADMPAIRENVRAQREISQEKLERYRRSQESMLKGRSEEEYVTRASRIGPSLTLQRGIVFEEGNVRWCDAVLAALDARAER